MNNKQAAIDFANKCQTNLNISWEDTALITTWFEKAIQQIQLDAFKAGMTRAASKCIDVQVPVLYGTDTFWNKSALACAEAIQVNRDNLKELP
jgi:hypothetical protein